MSSVFSKNQEESYLKEPQISPKTSSFCAAYAVLDVIVGVPPHTLLVLRRLLFCWVVLFADEFQTLGCAGMVGAGADHPELAPQAPAPVLPIMLVICVGCCLSEGTFHEDEPGLWAGTVLRNKERISCLTSFLGCSGATLEGITGGGAWKSRENRSSWRLGAGSEGGWTTGRLGTCAGVGFEKFVERSWCAWGCCVVNLEARGEGSLLLKGKLFLAGATTGCSCDGGGGGASAGKPTSRTLGSGGGGPSFAHRRDSYLERMKDSILLDEWRLKNFELSRGWFTHCSGGMWPDFRCASQ